MKKPALLAFVVLAALGLGACHKNAATSAAQTERKVSGQTLLNMEKTQPIPERPWSQLRQNLIELETAQTDTTQTTSFFFNQGVQSPIQSCPSIGYPIASTTELTNPLQTATGPNHSGLAIPQIDPNGVYAGESTGTYVICVDAQGRAYADYWEGFVQTVTGPAKWDDATKSVELIGAPSFKFSTQKP